MKILQKLITCVFMGGLTTGFFFLVTPASGQLVDATKAPNTLNEGIHKSFIEEIGAGRGDITTANSSLFMIGRDPFRAIRRGRQLFQRKYTRQQGQGPLFGDGAGNINKDLAIGAGLADSCAACHGRPRGAAGSGGDVVTRPDSRDAPHLFGIGLREMLADEITADLRDIRAKALAAAISKNKPVIRQLVSKEIKYGQITAKPDGSFDTSLVQGVNDDLRVRPFFAHGGTISIREFIVGALKNEMGLEAVDPDLDTASNGGTITTPAGMVLDGNPAHPDHDTIERPPASDPINDPDGDGVANEIPESIVDYYEFYLLNYFTAATYEQTERTETGRKLFMNIKCGKCHIPDLPVDRDRRVANMGAVYDPVNGIINNLFATATASYVEVNDGTGLPPVKNPALQPFLVQNIFTDFKRHDLGPNFYERNYDGTMQTEFLTRALWGVGTTGPYGHDGRSINLKEVILRHGGEAQAARDAFANLRSEQRSAIIEFLNSLVLFPPDDTASNLNPGNRNAPNFPQQGHGSISLTVLFNDPGDIE
jgi:mono/diheme cytochrome c family protein